MEQTNNVSVIVSFLAGIATFVSPCILPLVPAYISFITGVSLEDLRGAKVSWRNTILNSLFFVLGFTVIFTILGISVSLLSSFLIEKMRLLNLIGGSLIILFGLHVAGFLKIKFLYKQKKVQIKKKRLGYAGTFVFGCIFAIGWTPCVGPILASILILASTEQTLSRGILLLISYSIGLGVPFIITALLINKFLSVLEVVKKYYRKIEVASGLLLVIIGILIIARELIF